MAKRPRFDEPGAWHHVMNRGIARRTIMETHRDARQFLAYLARSVRTGWFEVHAYTILNTHFHLLLRSTTGEIWRGMQLFENGYVRWFNRTRRRDGPLLRGRFTSRRIESDIYWRTVVRYIDMNAASARIPFRGRVYPHCSFYHYLRKKGPPWLKRDTVERIVRQEMGKSSYNPDDYARSLGHELKPVEERLVEEGLDSGLEEGIPLEDILTATPRKVRSWMLNKARMADGTRPGLPVADSRTLLKIIKRLASESHGIEVEFNGTKQEAWPFLTAGLLRCACGSTFEQVSEFMKCSTSTAYRRTKVHASLMIRAKAYADLTVEVLSEALRKDWRIINRSGTRPARKSKHR